jgi:hypothetical protein
VILTNPSFTEIFKIMETEIIKLMENIGVIPQQVSQYMQNQAFIPPVANLPNATLPQQNPNTPNGGVFPGSNPMDLLQLQQLQQFYQMQAAQNKK